MALDLELTASILQILRSRFLSHELSTRADERLVALNNLAASRDVDLSAQSDTVTTLIISQLEKPSSLNLDDTVNSIYLVIEEQMARETHENRRTHNAQGQFSKKRIHRRPLNGELDDGDMSMIMPPSDESISVLAPINRFDTSLEAVQHGIKDGLNNNKVHTIIFPVGPGHWRGVVLKKPPGSNENYQIELFDPYGPSGAATIEQIVLKLVNECGIDKNKITVTTTGPSKPQRDGFSCGDYVLAYMHQQMQKLGAPETTYNTDLISIYESHGNNENNGLRHEIRAISCKLSEQALSSRSSAPGSMLSSDVLAVEGNRILKAIEKSFTHHEKIVFATTLSSQQTPSPSYKKEIASLIKYRGNIFSQANAALEKERKAEPLSDEELAAKLQAEELIQAGLKPSKFKIK